MILDCVISACNMKPAYYNLIPVFISSWNKLYPNVDVKVILINETLPEELKKYQKNIICFKPIDGINTAFISQYIRLLYPCILNYENGILISDIDDIPLNTTFYTNSIENIDNNKWIDFGNATPRNQLHMMWQIATKKTWSEVFYINSLEDINKRLIDVYNNIEYKGNHGGKGWCTDQFDLFKYVMEWKIKTNNYVTLRSRGFRRLNPVPCAKNIDDTLNQITDNYFSDFHIWRPYKRFTQLNESIIKHLGLDYPLPELL